MADPVPSPVTGIASEVPGAVVTVENVANTASRSVGIAVENAAKAVVESVKTDAVTLVSKDASIGASLEAGLNLAADASSFVVGPEDAAGERAAVFAIKEAAEHAPQIAEATAAGLHAAVEAAPVMEAGAEKLAVSASHALDAGAVKASAAVAKETAELGKGAESVFDHLRTSLEAAGHEIKNSDPARHFIETSKSVWHAVEGSIPEWEDTKRIGNIAEKVGKDVKMFAPKIESSAEDLMRGGKAVLAKTESELAHAMKETGLVKEGVEFAKKTYDRVEKIAEVGKQIKEGYEHIPAGVKKGIEAVAIPLAVGAATEGKEIVHGAQHLVTEAEQHVVAAGQNISSDAHGAVKRVEHVVHEAVQAAGHLAHEAGKSLESAEHTVADGAKKTLDAIEAWHPSMSFEKFGSLMNRIRGGSQSRDASHEQTQTLAKTHAQHQGVDR